MAKLGAQWINVEYMFSGDDECVMLPLDDEKRQYLMESLRIENLSDGFISTWCMTEGLKGLYHIDVNFDTDIEQLSKFAEWVMWACERDTDPNPVTLLVEVINAESPYKKVSLDRTMEIATNIDRYEFVSETDAFNYGYEYLYGGNNDMTYSEFAESVEKYIDFEEYGKMRLEADGAIKTEHGYVIEHDDIQPVQSQEQSM